MVNKKRLNMFATVILILGAVSLLLPDIFQKFVGIIPNALGVTLILLSLVLFWILRS